MSGMFILIMSIMYLVILYVIIVSFLDPMSLIILPVEILVTWAFKAMYTNIFPKTKKNYLKFMHLYDKYEAKTKHI